MKAMFLKPDNLKYWFRLDCMAGDKKNQKPVTHFAKRIYLHSDGRGVYLTKREAECIYHLANGFTRKQISHRLNLSTRTVESYINLVKVKLKISKQKALLSYILETDFLKNYIDI